MWYIRNIVCLKQDSYLVLYDIKQIQPYSHVAMLCMLVVTVIKRSYQLPRDLRIILKLLDYKVCQNHAQHYFLD